MRPPVCSGFFHATVTDTGVTSSTLAAWGGPGLSSVCADGRTALLGPGPRSDTPCTQMDVISVPGARSEMTAVFAGAGTSTDMACPSSS